MADQSETTAADIERRAKEIAFARRPPHLADKDIEGNWFTGAEEWRMGMREIARRELANER